MKSINEKEQNIIRGIVMRDSFMHEIHPYLQESSFKSHTASVICLACKDFYLRYGKEGSIREDIIPIYNDIKGEIRVVHRKEIRVFLKKVLKTKRFATRKNLYSSIVYLLSNKYLNLKGDIQKYTNSNDIDKVEEIVYVQGGKIADEIEKYHNKLKQLLPPKNTAAP